MPFNGKVGDSIFIDDLSDGHRYVIITKPNSNNEVVIVNFTTRRIDKDCTVTFYYRDNPIFLQATVVNYPHASFMSFVKIKNEATNPYSDYKYLPNEIIQKIIIGAFQSQFTPIGVLKELQEQYPNIAEKYFLK